MNPSGRETRQRRRITFLSDFFRPAILLISLDLPPPFWAKMPSLWPRSTRNATRSRITLCCVPVQKDVLTVSNSIISLPRSPAPLALSEKTHVNMLYAWGILPDKNTRKDLLAALYFAMK